MNDQQLPEPSGDLFGSVYAAERVRVVRLAALMGSEDPEATAQEAFARVFQRASHIRDPAAIVSYLTVTVVNLTRRSVADRRRFSQPTTRMLAAFRPAPSAPIAAAQAFSQTPSSPLREAILALPTPQRQALVLRYWLDLSVNDVADAMAVPEGTAKSHLSRALKTLRAAAVTASIEGIEWK